MSRCVTSRALVLRPCNVADCCSIVTKRVLDVLQKGERITDGEQPNRRLQMINTGRGQAAGDDLKLPGPVRHIPQSIRRVTVDMHHAIIVALPLGLAVPEVFRLWGWREVKSYISTIGASWFPRISWT